jgi:hypothetical protein
VDTARQTLQPWVASNNKQLEHNLSMRTNSNHMDKLSIKTIHTANTLTTTAHTGLHTRTNIRHTANNKEVSEDHSAVKEECTTSPTMDMVRMRTTNTRLRQPMQQLLVVVRQALAADLETMDALDLHNLRKPSQLVPARSVATPSAVRRVAFQVKTKHTVNSNQLSRVPLKTHWNPSVMASLELDQAQAPLANQDVPDLPPTRPHKLRNLVFHHHNRTSKDSVRTPTTLNKWVRLHSMVGVSEDSVDTQLVPRAIKLANMVLTAPDLATITTMDRMVDAVVAGAETTATRC